MTEAFNDFETTAMIPEPSSTRAAVLTLYDIFIPLLGIFIILLNSLVVISSGLLLRKRKEPRSTYLFLGNVGLADLLTGIAVLFGHFYPRERRCELSCAIQIGMIVSSTIVSVLSVLLVAIDRFLYILYGLKYQRYVYPNRARVLIVATWIIGFITGFLPAMAPSLRGTMSARQCWFILLDPGLILATTLIGILPILIVFILYSIILYIALRKISELKRATSGENGTETANNLRYFRGSAPNLNQMREVSDSTVPLREQPSNSSKWWHCCCWKSETGDIQQTETPSSKEPSKWKAIKIVMFTTGAFFVTWVPYFIASTMFIYCDQESNPRYCNGLKIAIASPLAILGFANSLINPVIYAWWHTGFRTNSIRIWSQRLRDTKCCRCCFNKSDEGSSWYYRATSSLSPGTANLSSTTNLSTSSIQNVTATNCIPTQKPRQLGICKANLFNDANRNPSANSATAATSDLER